MASPRWYNAALLMATAIVGLATPVWAQPDPHYRLDANLPPGAIGQSQLRRGGPLVGFFQPVELVSSGGANVAMCSGGRFDVPSQRVLGGFLIGQVYRLQVTDIPLFEGQEVYPTLEVIDRTYAPRGREFQFPITIEISQDDLKLALSGKIVTRVIYVENPREAIAAPKDPKLQQWFDVRPGLDPLFVADTLGRPVAILRMGGRVPLDALRPDATFLYGSPMWLKVTEKDKMEER